MIPETSTRTGSLTSPLGDLPLEAMDVRARVIGLVWEAEVRQTFVNCHGEPLEAVYVFPLPDRAAVHAVRLEIAGRVIPATLKERGQAREQYETAIAGGKRAATAEEDRPGVFTVTVGNLAPNERAVITLELGGVCAFDAGEATFRFPLVVAPRHVSGTPTRGLQAGRGTQADTDAVPDASRVSPPQTAQAATPVALSLKVTLSGAGLEVRELTTALHPLQVQRAGSCHVVRLPDGTAMDRDFILRWKLDPDAAREGLIYAADPTGDEGTWQLTVCVGESAKSVTPRDVAFVLDRSGSMKGWKLEAAKRALGRILDALTYADRFALVSFSDQLRLFDGGALGAATDRRRFDGLQELATISADGGTELLPALLHAADCFGAAADARERTIVVVTDGQVANEAQLLERLAPRLKGARVFAVGIDQAVGAGLLNRLADLTGGRADLVESHERLDEVLEGLQSRLLHAAVLNPVLETIGASIASTQQPSRLPHVSAGTPLVVMGRSKGSLSSVVVRGQTADGERWTHEARTKIEEDGAALRHAWARAQVRSLEDRCASWADDRAVLERQLIATSLRFGVLCRFTAFVLEDADRPRVIGAALRTVQQPVQPPAGWASGVDAPISVSNHRAAGRAMKTQAGILKGKFHWMAPEQVRGLPLTAQTDVHHLGLLLHFVLTLKRLYAGDSDFAILTAIRDPVPRPIFTHPQLQPLENLVGRMLEVDPELRPTASQVVRELDVLLAGATPALGELVSAWCPELVHASQLLAEQVEQLSPAADECLLLRKLSIDELFITFAGVIRGAGGKNELVMASQLIAMMAEDEELLAGLLDTAMNDHPGVIAVREMSVSGKDLWQLRSWSAGVPLSRLIHHAQRTQLTLPLPVALAVVRQVAATVAALHAEGIVFRNIEPAEICVRFDGRVVIALNDAGRTRPAPLVRRNYVGLAQATAPPPAIPAAQLPAARVQPWYAFWK